MLCVLHETLLMSIIVLDKSGYQVPVNIFLISPQKHVVGTHKKRPQHMLNNINTFGLQKAY